MAAQPSLINSKPEKKRQRVPTCYYCGQKGHIQPNCSKKASDERKGIHHGKSKQKSSSSSSSSSGSALVLSSAPTSSNLSDGGDSFSFVMPGESKQESCDSPDSSIDHLGFCFAIGDIISSGQWVLDSAATQHITSDESLLHDTSSCGVTILTRKAGESITMTKKGVVVLTPTDASCFQPVTITDVYQSPNAACNILSIPQ